MIKLDKPICSHWTGDGDGDPIKVTVDHFKILRRDVDELAKTITITGVYGYLENGEFKRYDQGGSTQIVSKTILNAEKFDAFLGKIKHAGAPEGDFRVSDLEDEIIAQELVIGQRLQELIR
ncbi:MAG: hypothetical protein JXA73_08850 [Acidobacteria bacterium]|nr:hypothetical protein [Acidobacteriota bacterium]